MTTLLLPRRETAPAHLARRVARAIGGFEHALLGRVPHSLTVVASGDRLVVNLLESFSPLEQGLAAVSGGAGRIRDFHHGIFESCHEALVQHVRRRAGVALDAGIVHVDATTGSIIKTYTTESSVDLFILGQGVPALGVPVNAHLHAHGAAGTGAVRS